MLLRASAQHECCVCPCGVRSARTWTTKGRSERADRKGNAMKDKDETKWRHRLSCVCCYYYDFVCFPFIFCLVLFVVFVVMFLLFELWGTWRHLSCFVCGLFVLCYESVFNTSLSSFTDPYPIYQSLYLHTRH